MPEFHDRVAANFSAVLAIITQAENSTDAMEALAPLLGVDDIEVLVRLSKFSLMSLNRGAQAARTEKLAELRTSAIRMLMPTCSRPVRTTHWCAVYM